MRQLSRSSSALAIALVSTLPAAGATLISPPDGMKNVNWIRSGFKRP
jgi:hypothetical protein